VPYTAVTSRRLSGRYVSQVEDRERRARLVLECDVGADGEPSHLVRADPERHRNRPHGAAREPHALDDAGVVRLAHEPVERAESADDDHLEVRECAAIEPERRQPSRFLLPVRALGRRGLTIDEHAAVRRDGILEMVFRHRVTLRAGAERCKRISVRRRGR